MRTRKTHRKQKPFPFKTVTVKGQTYIAEPGFSYPDKFKNKKNAPDYIYDAYNDKVYAKGEPGYEERSHLSGPTSSFKNPMYRPKNKTL